MNLGKLICGITIVATLAGSYAHAGIRGSEGVGGGVGIICDENGVEKVYLADTFDLVRNGSLRGIESVDNESLFRAALAVLDERSPEKIYTNPFQPEQKVNLAWMVEHTRANLQFKYVESIPNLSDDNIDQRSLPSNCRKEQIAVQEVGRGIVREKFKMSSRMSSTERGLFEVHETLVALRNAPGADTTPIRQKIAEILGDPQHSFQNMLKNLVFQKNIRDAQTPPENWASRLRSSKYCKFPNYLTTISDLFWLATCNTAEDFLPPARPNPPVRQLPRSLQCQIMTELNNDLGWHPPTHFRIHEYALSFDGPTGTAYPKSSKIFSSGYPFPSKDGKQVFPISDSMKWGDITIFLHKYVERTGEFIGGLQNGDISKYTYFGISCVPADL
jgi:hypothetical protein